MGSLPAQDPVSPETISLSRHPPPGGTKEQPGPFAGSPGSGQRPANKAIPISLDFLFVCSHLSCYGEMLRYRNHLGISV